MSHQQTRRLRLGSFLLSTLMLLSVFPLTVSAMDSDGDGVNDTLDDCPWAYGTSTIDRDGCPDRDGDGTSDLGDSWTSNNPNFSEDFFINNIDAYSVDHNPDGSTVAVATGDRVRTYNASTFTVVSTSPDLVGGNNAYVTSLDWSPDGMYVATTLSDDTAALLWASNLTLIHDDITHSGGSRTFSDVAFMANSTSFAVVDETSGGWGGGTCSGCAVMLVNVADGEIWREITPAGNSGSYSSVAFSPDGSRMAVGGDGNAYLINTTTWSTVRAMNPQSGGYVHSIDFSPDGTMIAMCTGYDNGNSRLRAFATSTGASLFNQQATSSCYGVDVSPDSKQVAFSIGYFQADGGSLLVYEPASNLLVDRIQLARGTNSCNQNNNNPCGNVNSASWHPDGIHLVAAVSRNYEGINFLFADLDPDNDGYNSTNQGDGVVDAFPDDGTQWADTDGDGIGDNPEPATEPDACIATAGTSNMDRFGCLDSDGDGYSDPVPGTWDTVDGADAFPSDSTQWVDVDGDGRGDNYLFEVDDFQLHINQTGDAFPADATQWNDTDGDGWGDNYANTSWGTNRPSEWPGAYVMDAGMPDAFPLDRTQHMDTDGDSYGDNQNSDRADACPNDPGNSQFDRLGCVDSDGDGYSDPTPGWGSTTDCFGADAFPNDATQWCDEDNDGFGSNVSGNNADDCPSSAGSSTIDRKGCTDWDNDGYSNAGDPFPNDATQWSDRDGDGRGDNLSGNNPDLFPDESSQWADTDGDGYGDNPGGVNGDAFATDASQWSDTDNDGYGDNLNGTNGDLCPTDYGESQNPESRGCPDSDLDGYSDPVDAFPDDPFQWVDTDGDGFGDNQRVPNGDDCIDVAGTSYENARQGCLDSDGDGWADVDDAFPEDGEQWSDTDGDGWGDNYFFTNRTVADEDNVGEVLVVRDQRGDAFPDIATQWSDVDGDGWGDNLSSFNRVDNFPMRVSQWNDLDGDGFGDNVFYLPVGSNETDTPLPAYQPDECLKEPGTSYVDVFGCVDSDGDGVSDLNDPCVWDPAVSDGARTAVTCSITSDPNATATDDESDSFLAAADNTIVYMGGAIIFMLALIFVAQISRAAGRRKAVAAKREEQMVQESFGEEDERRLAWIQHYIAEGNYAEARALGWEGQEGLPQWKQHEMQQEAAQQAAIPTMVSLEDL